MELKYDPFPLIFTQGDETTQIACLALFGQGDSPRSRACQEIIRAGQRPDGAFPSSFDPAHWGMQETVRHPLIGLDAGTPPEDAVVTSSVRFLLEHQNRDGGWSENPALEIPPQMTWLSSEHGITWLTADVVRLLRRVGRGEQLPCQAALVWLRAIQNRQGGWPSVAREAPGQADDLGDPDATAQITFLMGEIYGQEDAVFCQGKRLFEHHLDECVRDAERGYWIRARDGEREEVEVYTLTHLLLSSLVDAPSRLRAGYDVSDPRIRRIMEVLVEIQDQDGGWRPFFLEESSPLYTVLAVKVLVQGGAIPREDLTNLVKPHAS
jgi:hypothetical protein